MGALELRTQFVTSQFTPRSVVSVIRPLKSVTLVRFQLGEQMVAVVYWSARLAVNEEVRVRSPPVTQRLGVGQWLATWPGTRSTQVRFLPPRQGDVVQREDAAFASLK